MENENMRQILAEFFEKNIKVEIYVIRSAFTIMVGVGGVICYRYGREVMRDIVIKTMEVGGIDGAKLEVKMNADTPVIVMRPGSDEAQLVRLAIKMIDDIYGEVKEKEEAI